MKSSAPALQRGLRILELAARTPGGTSFAEVCRQIDIPSSTAARLVHVLIDSGYLNREDATGRYLVGPQLGELTAGTTERDRFRRESEGMLPSLREATGNTVLAIHWNGQTLECVAKQMHESAIAMQQVGDIRADIMCYPWSPFVFDAIEDERGDQELRRSSRTHRSSDASAARRQAARFRAALKSCERDGYILDESKSMVRIAAPVRATGGRLVGAIGLGGTRESLPESRVRHAGGLVAEYADTLSQAMGWSMPRPHRG